MRVSAWPAKRGDSLLVEWGTGAAVGRMLVDCGFKSSYQDSLRSRLAEFDDLDLLVVTHVDIDHVNGVLEMYEVPARPVTFGDVWFNTFEHLEGKRVVQPEVERFGGPAGEELSVQLVTQKQPWNKAFDGRPVSTTTPMTPIRPDVAVTLVSPTVQQLAALTTKWERECEDAGIKPGFQGKQPDDTTSPFERFGVLTVADVRRLAADPFQAEDSESNASTIALLIEADGQRALLTGDAAAGQLADAIRPLAQAAGGKLPLHLMQVPHHGSNGNISRELLELVECQRFIISTDGSSHEHPHTETIARILVFGGGHRKEIAFNYRGRAERWRSTALQNEFGYDVIAPDTDDDGATTLDLGAN